MKIVTHGGGFHTDDVFAVAVLLLLNPDAEVARSRDPEVWKTADILVDVGGMYDPTANKFDHHMPEGAGKRDNGIPYASFGLVWKEYGERLAGGKREAERFDRKLVQPVDAIDNGVAIADYRFKDVRDFGIGDFFASYMTVDTKREEIDDICMKCVGIAKDLVLRQIAKAQEVVRGEDLLTKAYMQSDDKRLIELPYDEKLLPWKRILGEYPEPLYVLYPRSDGGWGVRAVTKPGESFVNRKDLPAAWAGKGDKELQMLTGVPDAVFAHRTLFMAAARSKEGAEKLAQIALNS